MRAQALALPSPRGPLHRRARCGRAPAPWRPDRPSRPDAGARRARAASSRAMASTPANRREVRIGTNSQRAPGNVSAPRPAAWPLSAVQRAAAMSASVRLAAPRRRAGEAQIVHADACEHGAFRVEGARGVGRKRLRDFILGGDAGEPFGEAEQLARRFALQRAPIASARARAPPGRKQEWPRRRKR